MSKTRLVEKLGMKPGMRLLIKGAFEGYVNLLAPLPEGTEFTSAGSGELAFVQLFLLTVQELEALTLGDLAGCGHNGLLWITYPKKSSGLAPGLSRDLIRETLKRMGWRAVTIVAVDDTWAALRFRPIET